MLTLLQYTKPTRVAVGLRVVRGDGWDYENQDGGDGFVGTVVEVGGQGGSKNPDKTVVVVWDTGVRAKYRAGYHGKDDLRVYDNAPTGSVSPVNNILAFCHISEYLPVYFNLIFRDVSQPSQARQ